MLENEEKDENAAFRVKEVQYIQAEVKIIKCLVENIVVDISFNQLGGLCTLCFLEEVDNLINQNHLFKRSIILIKAWCYYESRILGAHHGLISTYALETLVLYIFNVFNNTFAGPLEVLYRFLEFFSKFDWDNFCVSLWGPVPISSLPDVTAEPPRKDGGELLLSKLFLDACNTVYAVFPGGQESQGQAFVSKHFNVIDPLRINNNLGRSVSKGNFFRIRSAFAFGARRLARLLDCPKEDLYYEVNQFFMNTWNRHVSGYRPDALRKDLWHLRLLNPDHSKISENLRNNSSSKISDGEAQVDMAHASHGVPSQHGSYPKEGTSRGSETSSVSHTQMQKTYVNSNNARTSDQSRREIDSSQSAVTDKNQRSYRPDNFINDLQAWYPLSRTHSSPELTDGYTESSSQKRRNRVSDGEKGQTSSAGLDNNKGKTLQSDNMSGHSILSSNDDPLSVRPTSSRQNLGTAVDSNNASNSNHDDSGFGDLGEEFPFAMGTQAMKQKEQDLVNMRASSAGLGFNGQVHVPLNLMSSHMPFPIPPSVLASMGCAQRNLGIMPTNISLMESAWATNMQFPQGLAPSSLTHYFPGIGLTSNLEEPTEPGNENFAPTEVNLGEANHDFWHEQERGSTGGFDIGNGSLDMHQSNDKQQSTSASYSFVHSSHIGGPGSSSRVKQKFTKEIRASTKEDHADTLPYQENRGAGVYFNDGIVSSRSIPSVHTSSLRSKTPSENLWGGSSAKTLKSTREKRGRKTSTSSWPSTVYGKGKSVSDHSSNQTDDDAKDWNVVPVMGPEMTERGTAPQTAASLHVSRHQSPGFKSAQTSGSESSIPIGPVLLGPGSQQRSTDNSGVVPFAFYPTGPPVPFVTMLPICNYPTETGTPVASMGQLTGEDGPNNSDSSQNFDLSEGIDQPEALSASSSMRRAASVEPLEHKSDILHSDFASHWQNLQYGRFCQSSGYPAPPVCPSPVMVPPTYLQGHIPWDGPGRPLSTNMNLLSQLMSYGPHLVPVAPLHSVSSRPTVVYQHYSDEMPRCRSGTGTYLPNPKAAVRDRTNTRKGNYNYDRSDHHGEREGNWNIYPKSRATGRGHSRSQAEKLSSRQDRLGASENRVDRVWGSHRRETFPSYQSQNGPLPSNSTQSGSADVAYGMYPLPSINHGGVSSNGPTMPSVVMFYPYDHKAGSGSPAEQLEFGSFGPVGSSGVNEVSHYEGSRLKGAFEDQLLHGSTAQQSLPDQPSSPHHKR
uniref:Uncharacterized protein MANES_01G247200 n=2 Tax=Rhizophora mucronata TaxID=61149 RepID=A0A2P2M8I0_RHIMU